MMKVNQIYIGALLMAIPITMVWATVTFGYLRTKNKERVDHATFWATQSFIIGFYIVFLSLL
jgi:hypothetical protein